MTAAAARRVLEMCRRRGIRLVSAESCTGGMIAAALTDIAGSSDVFERGFVTYSNEAKTDCLGVPAALIAQVGAVSEEVARAMAHGALGHNRADLSVAVTGIAGPGGGTAAKPVGLVHLAVAMRNGGAWHQRQVFPGDRSAVRAATVECALDLLLRALSEGITAGPAA